MIYIIGSGPSGVSAAHALLSKGKSVTMLDCGVELESKLKKRKTAIAKHWHSSQIERMKKRMQTKQSTDPLKYTYGSDYPFQKSRQHLNLHSNSALCLPSFAKGGLSTIWGGQVMPFLDEDISDWPITTKDLASHYKALHDFMPFSYVKSELDDLFKHYHSVYHPFKQSRQAKYLLQTMRSSKKQLHQSGIFFGSSRLAVNFSTLDKDHCVYCGLCLYGCPLDLIYNTFDAVGEFKKNKKFTYREGIIVNYLKENKSGVTIYATDTKTKKQVRFQASKIFLGAGVLQSTKILLQSMKAYNTPITLKDSQHFMLPLLTSKAISNVKHEKLHTLCQLYLELFDKKIDPHSIHLQIYTYNDLFSAEIKRRLSFLYPLAKPFLSLFLNRVIFMQGYLHSNSSSSASVVLKKDNSLHLFVKKNKKSPSIIHAILRKLTKNRKLLKIHPIKSQLKISKLGEGNHYGGTFPMRKKPKQFESDIYGRPYGFSHVHLIDVSTFPSIATQTITYTIMANAHRIASTYQKAK